MDIEKQTYLNTEQLQTLFEKQGKAVACYGAGSRYGGVRFTMRARGRAALSVRFHSIAADATISLDGATIAKTRYPSSYFDLTLSKGEHVLDVGCTSHGGFVLRVEGVGVEEGARYFDRVGGHSSAEETVVYTSNGDRQVNAHRKTASTSATSLLSTYAYDDAQLYDKTNEAYASTVRSAYTGSSHNNLVLSVGSSYSLSITGVRSVAMCDGRTLESGADYLAACATRSGVMTVVRVAEGTPIDATCLATMPKSVLRVVSAQRGSVLITQSPDYVWTAHYFHAQGEHALTFTNHTFHYDSIPLCRNRYVAPSATVDEENGTPIFYYRKEDGELMRMAYGGAATRVGYQEAYHAGLEGGYHQYAGEVRYETA